MTAFLFCCLELQLQLQEKNGTATSVAGKNYGTTT